MDTVTNQFVALRRGASCDDIPVSNIAEVKQQPPRKRTTQDRKDLIFLLATAPLWLLVFIGLPETPESPIPGSWESIQASSDGRITRTSLLAGSVLRRRLRVKTGSYRITGTTLHLNLDGSAGGEKTVPIRFDCASLIVEDSPTPLILASATPQLARAPIEGRWNGTETTYNFQVRPATTNVNSVIWEFLANGHFQSEEFTDSDTETGSYQRSDDGVLHIQFRTSTGAAHDEDWRVRIKSDRLWIIHDGATEEYRKTVNFESARKHLDRFVCPS